MELLMFNDDAGVLGISPDGPFSHRRFIEENNISYPLLTDDGKRVYDQYGMLERADDETRQHKRGVVLIDADHTVRYRWVAESNLDPWEPTPLHEAYDRIEELIDVSER